MALPFASKIADSPLASFAAMKIFVWSAVRAIAPSPFWNNAGWTEVRLTRLFATGSQRTRSDCAAADWRKRIIILPLDMGSSSSGRSKTLFGIVESGWIE